MSATPRLVEKEAPAPGPTPEEVLIARAWEAVLGIHPIGVRDNSFELGGNSLLAIRLLSRIRTSLGKSPPVAALFQDATVEHQAGLLRQEAGPWSPLVELRKGGGKRCLERAQAAGSERPEMRQAGAVKEMHHAR